MSFLLDAYRPDAYPIVDRLLPSGSYGPARAVPAGYFVIHASDLVTVRTGTYTVEQLYREFRPENKKSAPFAIDPWNIQRLVPDDQVAWHVGTAANRVCSGVELCITASKSQAQEVFRRGIWLAVRHALQGYRIVRHADISRAYPRGVFGDLGSDHTDPDQFLEYHGYSWAQFKANVDALVQQAAPAEAASGTPIPVDLPDGTIITGYLRGDATWVKLLGVWRQLRPEATNLGMEVQWIGPESGGPRVVLRLPLDPRLH